VKSPRSSCEGWGLSFFDGGGSCSIWRRAGRGEELYVAKAGGIESGREWAGEKSQALAGFRGIDETGEDGLAVVGEDFDGVFIDDDLDAY